MAISRSRSCWRGGCRNIEEATAISRRQPQYGGGDRNIEEAMAISRRWWQYRGGDGNIEDVMAISRRRSQYREGDSYIEECSFDVKLPYLTYLTTTCSVLHLLRQQDSQKTGISALQPTIVTRHWYFHISTSENTPSTKIIGRFYFRTNVIFRDFLRPDFLKLENPNFSLWQICPF